MPGSNSSASRKIGPARHVLVGPDEPFGDLHVHTDFSDGLHPPEKVVEQAAALGMSFLAIADHDTVRGVTPARVRARELGLRLIPAVEISATTDIGDVHFLAYFVDVEDDAFNAALAAIAVRRRERVVRMIERLREIGVPADPDAYFTSYPKGLAGRLNLSSYLVSAGLVPSKEEVFARYLGRGCPAYEPVDALTTLEALRIIRSAGGVSVMAHPGRGGMDPLIPELAAEGLCGIEAYHSSHSQAAAKSYRRLAEGRGLLVTAGSDCHGRGEPWVLMGTVRAPVSFVEALEAKAAALREVG